MQVDAVSILLWRDLAIFLMFGAVLGVVFALLLIFNTPLVERLNQLANRWVSTRRFNYVLDRSISIERWFYRHHRVAGISIMLGSAYIFIYFGFMFDQVYALRHLHFSIPPKMLQALLEAIVWGALIFSIFTLLMGLLISLRPSVLKGFEQQANQWVTLRRATKPLQVPRDQVDVFVLRYAHFMGWLLLLGSLYLLFILLRLWA